MVRKTLNEYKWRKDRDFKKIEVIYVDRLNPRGYSVIQGEEIMDMGDKFIFTKNGMIPYHRVLRILYDGKIVWERISEYHNTHKKKEEM